MAVREEISEKRWSSVLSDLFKVRLTALVLLTTLVGFYTGSRGPVDYVLMFHTLLGTGLLACGAAALNQLLEHEFDGKMQRTSSRPLPSGLMTYRQVLLVGVGTATFGLIWLACFVNPLTAFLGVLTLVSYLFLYTPLKRITTLNTAVGAIPGAIPPLMGWTASRGYVSVEGWSLFAILFFWQLPHFLAIAWMYREDYARGGFSMLPVVDKDGGRTGRQAFSHALGLLPVSLFPAILGVSGVVYFVGALVLSTIFAKFAWDFARELSHQRARALFFASIIYLPLLFALLVFDKVK